MVNPIKNEQGERYFKNRNAVLGYLKDQGYKIQKTKLYKDSNAGMLRIQSDGTVMLSDVDLYIKAYLLPVKTSEAIESEKLIHDRLTAEVKRLSLQAEKLEFEIDKDRGRYIPRDQFEMELAARAAVLEAGIKHLFYSRVSDWIHMVGGDTTKINDLLEEMTRSLDEKMNEYASMEQFQVIFSSEE